MLPRRRHGGAAARCRPGPLHAAVEPGAAPPIEWFIGPVDVVHGTNFVVPPTTTGRRGGLGARPDAAAPPRALQPGHAGLPRAHPQGPPARRLGPHGLGLRGRTR